MERALVVLGGYRCGDLLHCIPFFESIKDKDVHFVTGSYEKSMAELIQWNYPNISKLEIMNDGFPGDMNDRIKFRDRFFETTSSDIIDTYDDVFDDHTVSFDMSPLYWVLKDNYFNVQKSDGDYIVYHLDTVSDWKRHGQIRDLKVPNGVKAYSLGRNGEFVLPGTIDFTGQPLTDVVKLIAGAKMFVGIHSAMACLSLYINKYPSVVVHPMGGLLKFSDFRSGWTDLIMPTTEKLINTIEGLI